MIGMDAAAAIDSQLGGDIGRGFDVQSKTPRKGYWL